VSKPLPANSETIRSWEKSLAKDRWFNNLWQGARLAGQLEVEGHVVYTEDEIEPDKPEEIIADFEPESVPDYALRFLQRLNDSWSLEAVKENLARFHNS
jgi:hypothetical protein